MEWKILRWPQESENSNEFQIINFQRTVCSIQGMTDRRSDLRIFFRDREVIADLDMKKRSQGDRDREI